MTFAGPPDIIRKERRGYTGRLDGPAESSKHSINIESSELNKPGSTRYDHKIRAMSRTSPDPCNGTRTAADMWRTRARGGIGALPVTGKVSGKPSVAINCLVILTSPRIIASVKDRRQPFTYMHDNGSDNIL